MRKGVSRCGASIRLLQIILPNMACHQPSCYTGRNTLFFVWTVFANFTVAPIFTVSGTVGGFPCQFLFLWTKVNIFVLLIYETVFSEALSLVCMSAVSNHRLDPPGSDLVTGGSVVVSCIYAHVGWQVSKALFDVIQNIRYRVYIIDVGRSDAYIDNDVVLAVHCAMLAVVEPIRLPFLMQLTAFRVVFALLDLSRWWLVVILPVKGLLSQCFSVGCDGCIQFFHVCLGRLLDGHGHFPVFVCLGSDMGRICVQDLAAYQFLFHCLTKDLLKDLFSDIVLSEATCPVH